MGCGGIGRPGSRQVVLGAVGEYTVAGQSREGAIKAAEGGSRERGSVARHSLYRRNTFLSPNKAGALLWKRVPQSGNMDGLEIWALRSPTRCTSVDSTLMLAIKMILFSASDESLEPIIFFGLIIWFQKDNLGRSNNSYCDTFDIDPTFPKCHPI